MSAWFTAVGKKEGKQEWNKFDYQLCLSYNDRLSFFGTYHTCERSQLKLIKQTPNNSVLSGWCGWALERSKQDIDDDYDVGRSGLERSGKILIVSSRHIELMKLKTVKSVGNVRKLRFICGTLELNSDWCPAPWSPESNRVCMWIFLTCARVG